jgi:hypothetical protein
MELAIPLNTTKWSPTVVGPVSIEWEIPVLMSILIATYLINTQASAYPVLTPIKSLIDLQVDATVIGRFAPIGTILTPLLRHVWR